MMRGSRIHIIIGSAVAVTVLGAFLISWTSPGTPVYKEAEVRQAVTRSLGILQNSSSIFMRKGKCASCHHDILTAMACEVARKKNFSFEDSFRLQRIKTMDFFLKDGSINLHTLNDLPISLGNSYTLMGLYADGYKPSVYSDAMITYMINRARPDGTFMPETGRPPFSAGVFHTTAASIHAIRLYAPPAMQARVDRLAAQAKKWMTEHDPQSPQELMYKLLGLYWCGAKKEELAPVAEKLKQLQRTDGGWAQLNTLPSDAYATGEALFALYETGMISSSETPYQKGVDYLLRTQDESGAWIEESRTLPVLPFFNSDFPPLDENQFISAFATSWASLALVNALPDAPGQSK